MYKRVLYKISGEALQDKENGISFKASVLKDIADVIKMLREKGVEVGIVVGGGNIWRGKLADQIGIDPETADYMGMTGTVINAVAITSALRKAGCPAITFSAIDVNPITTHFDVDVVNELIKKNVCVFGGGTGKPFMSTDTAASLRAKQIKADVILMGKHGVDGVYSDDPNKNPNAQKFDILTFDEVIERKLGVMDLGALEMLKDTDIEIKVFSLKDPLNVVKVCEGQKIGSTVRRK